jgi:hypothetical protein
VIEKIEEEKEDLINFVRLFSFFAFLARPLKKSFCFYNRRYKTRFSIALGPERFISSSAPLFEMKSINARFHYFKKQKSIIKMTQIVFLVYLFIALLVVTANAAAGGAKALDAAKFNTEVVNDNKVWLVKFYSKRCGACTEFAPTWQKVTSKLTGFSFGEVSIDDKAGMKLAEEIGVLDEGLPNVRMFYQTQNGQGVSVATDESGLEASTILNNVKQIAISK